MSGAKCKSAKLCNTFVVRVLYSRFLETYTRSLISISMTRDSSLLPLSRSHGILMPLCQDSNFSSKI